MRIDQRGRRNGPDLQTHAAAVARELGVQVGERLQAPPGLLRVVVDGGDLVRPAVLVLADGAAFADDALRRAVVSEHLEEVRALPSRRVRGAVIAARTVERLPAGSLDDRISSGPLEVGEAVTILLAVVDVLHAAHHAGFGGVEPSADRVRFRVDGCPVVTEVDRVGALTQQRAQADAGAFLSLARRVALAVPDGRGASLLSRIEDVFRGGGGGLREAVLAEASPAAVRRLTGEAGASSPPEGQPPALRRDRGPRGTRGRTTDRGRARRRRTRGGGDGAFRRETPGPSPERRSAAWELALDGSPVREARSAVVRAMRRRPKTVLAVSVPLVAAIVGMAVVPHGRADTVAAEHSTTAVPSSTPSDAVSGVLPDGAADSAGCGEPDVFELTGDGASQVATGGPGGDASAPVCTPAEADDPAAAALAWLSSRGGAGSSANLHAEVTQRWGEAVLVRVEPAAEGESGHSEPASLLLVRGEAGWLVRAVYS
ncbi:hypothetical protein ACFVU2_10915 [Leifsonia sp. NPDC058194]|uniref:hypothetical protein n=1 Tax=Leifsonia sp. NPDC058194 TaxID=3346374 RepID=UPI0036D7C1F2